MGRTVSRVVKEAFCNLDICCSKLGEWELSLLSFSHGVKAKQMPSAWDLDLAPRYDAAAA